MKLLVCAPSNIAVDTVLARLACSVHKKKEHGSDQDSTQKKKHGSGAHTMDGQLQLRMVRLGHPARMSSDILMYSLDSLIATDEVCIATTVYSDLSTSHHITSHHRGQRS